MKKLLLTLALLMLSSAGVVAAQPAADTVRVYSASSHQFMSLDAALTEWSAQDVVFLGEVHNNPVCHQLELSILQGLTAKGKTVILGLEMFDRDVQAVLDGYLAGAVSAQDFQTQARPWPNYETDYKPLVEFARAQHLSVLASNIPEALIKSVSHNGLAALGDVPLHLLRYFARSTSAPADRYFELFTAAMTGHSGVAGHADDAVKRFYVSQCLRDDTMAESVADYVVQKGPDHPLVLHVNGSFHTDYGLGTASRTRDRLPQAHVTVISMIPVDNVGAADAASHADQGDYLIFVPNE